MSISRTPLKLCSHFICKFFISPYHSLVSEKHIGESPGVEVIDRFSQDEAQIELAVQYGYYI